MSFYENTITKILNILHLISQNLVDRNQNNFETMDNPFDLTIIEDKLKDIENSVIPKPEIQRRLDLNSNQKFYNVNEPRFVPKNSPISEDFEHILNEKENQEPFPSHNHHPEKGYTNRRRSRILERRNITPKKLDFTKM